MYSKLKAKSNSTNTQIATPFGRRDAVTVALGSVYSHDYFSDTSRYYKSPRRSPLLTTILSPFILGLGTDVGDRRATDPFQLQNPEYLRVLGLISETCQ